MTQAAEQQPRPEMDVNEVLSAVHEEYGSMLAQQAQRIAMLRVQLSDRDRQIHGQTRMLEILRAERDQLAGADRPVRVTVRDDERDGLVLPPV